MKLLIGYFSIVGTALFMMIWGASAIMTKAEGDSEKTQVRKAGAARTVSSRVNTGDLQKKRHDAMQRAAAQRELEKRHPNAATVAAPPEMAAEAKARPRLAADNSRFEISAVPAVSAQPVDKKAAKRQRAATQKIAQKKSARHNSRDEHRRVYSESREYDDDSADRAKRRSYRERRGLGDPLNEREG